MHRHLAASAASIRTLDSSNYLLHRKESIEKTTTFVARFAGNYQLVNPLQRTPKNLLSRCKKH